MIVGQEARSAALNDATNVIYDNKRILGRTPDDPSIQQIRKNWPFDLQHDSVGRAKIALKDSSVNQTFYPEEISAILLEKMKMIA